MSVLMLKSALQVIIDNSMGNSHSKKKRIDKTFNRRFGCGKGIFTYVSDDFKRV